MEREVIIRGDFNTNVLNSRLDCGLSKGLGPLCRMFDLAQLITEPTRVTESCASCIDLILVSDSDRTT